MYALVDCNNFFVSCERVFRPDLEGKPVLVMSGNDGCVIARSNEVKALGIGMGTPLFRIRDIIEREHITCFSTNFSLYGDISSRIMSLLSRHTESLQQYSIDEAFLRLDHLNPDECKPYCERIVREIRSGIGVPVSIGIAHTKTLAKVASKFAKKHPGYNGACSILTDEQRVKALSLFPIEDVWGIGRKNFNKMQMAGVRTALDLASHDEQWVSNLFSRPGIATWQELRGVDCIELFDLPEKKSITVSRTFASGITDRRVIESMLADFLVSCCEKLRRQRSVCQQMTVFAMSSRFRTDTPGHYLSSLVCLPQPTSNVQEMLGYMLTAFRREYRYGVPYKRAGIILSQISNGNAVQRSFFDERDRERDGRIQVAFDAVNHKFGRNRLRYAVQSSAEVRKDNFRLEHLSPRYTTSLDEIMTIKV